MPEGPEVKLMVDYLHPIINKNITKIKINGGRYCRHGEPDGYSEFKQQLPIKIKSIHSHGKFIYFICTKNQIMMSTLGLAGKWILKSDLGSLDIKHCHLEFHFHNKKILYFHDYRNFGTLKLTSSKDVLQNKLDRLGLDFLNNPKIKIKDLIDVLAKIKPNKLIGKVLLEQKYFSGIGNYIRADALYYAKISPHRQIKDITTAELKKLFIGLKVIFWSNYNYDYAIKNKIILKKQLFQKNVQLKLPYKSFIIFRQKEDPFGNPVIKENMGSRMIHYVPKIQT